MPGPTHKMTRSWLTTTMDRNLKLENLAQTMLDRAWNGKLLTCFDGKLLTCFDCPYVESMEVDPRADTLDISWVTYDEDNSRGTLCVPVSVVTSSTRDIDQWFDVKISEKVAIAVAELKKNNAQRLESARLEYERLLKNVGSSS